MLPASALDIAADYTVPAEGSTKNIVVKSGTNATITLDGNLTVTGSHAIAVEEGAVLTIKGTGTVEAIGKEFVPLYNNGTTTIDGGAPSIRTQRRGLVTPFTMIVIWSSTMQQF